MNRLRLAAILILGVALTAVSLSPLNRTNLGTASHFHRPAHWLAFGILAFLLALPKRSFSQRVIGFAATVALGVSIECLQYAIYNQPFEVWDIRDDTYGALGGFLAAILLSFPARLFLLSLISV